MFGSGFYSRTLFWTIVLITLPAGAQLIGGAPAPDHWNAWEGFFLFTAWGGLFLPFAAFGGGLAASERSSAPQLFASALAVAVASVLLSGYAAPHLEYRADREAGLNVSDRYPAGPASISGLSTLRDRALENPPAEFSFRVDRMAEMPPNWITYRIHSRIALSAFAVFAAFLGALSALLTTGLSPPARRNVRWAIGLGTGCLFFFAEAMGGEWVRASPLNPGLLGAWGPILVPVLELGILYSLLKRFRRDSTVLPSHSSND